MTDTMSVGRGAEVTRCNRNGSLDAGRGVAASRDARAAISRAARGATSPRPNLPAASFAHVQGRSRPFSGTAGHTCLPHAPTGTEHSSNNLVAFDEAHKYIDSPDLVAGPSESVREMRQKARHQGRELGTAVGPRLAHRAFETVAWPTSSFGQISSVWRAGLGQPQSNRDLLLGETALPHPSVLLPLKGSGGPKPYSKTRADLG